MRAKINFYEIDSCGYFKRNEDSEDFGTAEEVFADLHNWITNSEPTVRETQTFSVSEESSVLPCYCFSAIKNESNDYLVTIWNENQSLQGKFAAVLGDEAVGDPTVETSDVPAGGIPGYPTYFYIVPDQRLVAAIRFDGATTGIRNFNRYIRGFLERFSSWTVVEDEDDCLNSTIVGYHESDEDTPLRSYYPRFITRIKRKDGDIPRIRRKREFIRKIIRKDEYQVSIQKKQRIVSSFLSYFGINGDNALPSHSKYRFEFDYTPTESELNNIIDDFLNDDEGTRWDDVGFNMVGETDTYWLGSMNIKDDLEIEVRVNEAGIVNAQSLLRALNNNKQRIIRKFRS